MSHIDISVVIPVYGSQTTLRTLCDRLRAVFAARGESYEIVLVDDCSRDQSWQVLQQLATEDPQHIVAVQLMRNFGQHNATMCGFRQARGNWVVTMDDDLQHPPEEIPKLLAKMAEGDFDVVYGVYEAKRHGALRNFGSRFLGRGHSQLSGTAAKPTSFRVIRRAALDSLLTYDLNFTVIDGLFAWHTSRFGNVVVRHDQRGDGQSGYSLRKLIELAITMTVNFSLWPLQAMTKIGIFAALGGFAIGFFYLVQALLHQIAVPGYASIIIAVLVMGGLQLVALGILGEYVGRIHMNINRKPQYAVRQVLGGGAAAGTHISSTQQTAGESDKPAKYEYSSPGEP